MRRADSMASRLVRRDLGARVRLDRYAKRLHRRTDRTPLPLSTRDVVSMRPTLVAPARGFWVATQRASATSGHESVLLSIDAANVFFSSIARVLPF